MIDGAVYTEDPATCVHKTKDSVPTITGNFSVQHGQVQGSGECTQCGMPIEEIVKQWRRQS